MTERIPSKRKRPPIRVSKQTLVREAPSSPEAGGRSWEAEQLGVPFPYPSSKERGFFTFHCLMHFSYSCTKGPMT